MSSIVIRHARDRDGGDIVSLVHRRHDLSGTDYEGLARIEMDLALVLGRGGVVLREGDAPRHAGRPGVVFCPSDHAGAVEMEIRTDVAESGSAVKRLRVDRDMPSEILCNVAVDHIRWLHGEPSAKIAA